MISFLSITKEKIYYIDFKKITIITQEKFDTKLNFLIKLAFNIIELLTKRKGPSLLVVIFK